MVCHNLNEGIDMRFNIYTGLYNFYWATVCNELHRHNWYIEFKFKFWINYFYLHYFIDSFPNRVVNSW